MRHIVAIILLSISTITAIQGKRRSYGPPKQLSIEQVKSVPIDTVVTGDGSSKIIVFSNNTWKFY
ncbi:MAG: metalloendopeptidase, partial [Mucinivorans sp.]